MELAGGGAGGRRVQREESVTDVEASARQESESGTVRHVDSGAVMDGG